MTAPDEDSPRAARLDNARLFGVLISITGIMLLIGIGAVLVARKGAHTDTDAVSYEIAGTSSGALNVSYRGLGNSPLRETVTVLPWTKAIDGVPEMAGVTATPAEADARVQVTITIKRGDRVLKQCTGTAPCLVKT